MICPGVLQTGFSPIWSRGIWPIEAFWTMNRSMTPYGSSAFGVSVVSENVSGSTTLNPARSWVVPSMMAWAPVTTRQPWLG